MQSSFERPATSLDTSLPSVRHVQELIRHRTPVNVEMAGGQNLTGTLRWQDIHYLALKPDEGKPLILLNRHSIAILRSLA